MPSAPVQLPPAKAYQVIQPSADQLQAMAAQLQQSILQAFLQIVDGFLLPNTTPSAQLATWNSDIQSALAGLVTAWTSFTNYINSLSAAFQQDWLKFQNLTNSVVGQVDSDVTDLITALNATAENSSSAYQDWDTLFTNLGFSVTTSADLAAFITGVSNIGTDIAAFISNAITGGNIATSENSAVAYLEGLLGAIPHTNVLIPPSPGTGSITHDANYSADTPFNGAATGIYTINYFHTCGFTADFLKVCLGFYTESYTVVNVSYHGVQMQLLSSSVAPDGYTCAQIYGMASPPTESAYEVSVTVWTPFGGYVHIIALESDSYIGVGSVGSTAIGQGSNSNPSMSVPSASGEYIVQEFVLSSAGAPNYTESLTGYNQTPQYNSGNIVFNGFLGNLVLLAGDAAGASSVSFSATALSTIKNSWAAAAVNLIPLPATTLGSGFRAYNNSASTVNAAVGNNIFPNDFYNVTQTITQDMTYSTTGNALTVAEAGWYTVTVAVLLVSTYVDQWVSVDLYHNGSFYENGGSQFIASAASTTVIKDAFQIYLSAGDTVQPGYYSSAAGAAFTADTAGTKTYFSVGLMNRSLM